MSVTTQSAPFSDPQLTDYECALLQGESGPAMKFAMQLVVRAAKLMRAPCLIEAGFVHIDACHYYGRAHLDFARYLLKHRAKFEIPAWTNTVPASLIQPEVRDSSASKALTDARELARLYMELGAVGVWTCAPYLLPGSPGFAEHIIVGESNAVCYFNSVVGARTNKYGDFLDVACGLTRRVPLAGLHTDAGRRAELQIDLELVPAALRETELFCHVLGHLVGQIAGSKVPVITGLPASTSVDSLKALAAAGAASGGIGLYHAVGVTPEAPDLETVFQGQSINTVHRILPRQLIQARDSLSGARDGPISMVALGTPHFSLTEFARLVKALDGRRIHPDVVFYVTASRHVAGLCEAKGWLDEIQRAGVRVLVDTCTYFSPGVRGARGRVMTNSAKWAYYAPGMLPVEVALGSLEDCVESAVVATVKRNSMHWSDKFWGGR